MAAVIQAYRFALDSTPRQRRALASPLRSRPVCLQLGVAAGTGAAGAASPRLQRPGALGPADPPPRVEPGQAAGRPLPRIGTLKTHESTRKLARRLEQGSARILAATISRTADRWFVSFTAEVQRTIPTGNGKAGVVGVDVGIRHLAVLSTGAVMPNPQALHGSLRKLRRLHRELHRRTPGSRRRAQTRRRLARCMPTPPISAATPSTSSPPLSPPSTARLWSSNSTCPGWPATAAWPAPSPMPACPGGPQRTGKPAPASLGETDTDSYSRFGHPSG